MCVAVESHWAEQQRTQITCEQRPKIDRTGVILAGAETPGDTPPPTRLGTGRLTK